MIDALHTTRLAAYVINLVIKELGLGKLANSYSGEYASDWVIAPEGVRLIQDGRKIATVSLDDIKSPKYCTVIIDDIHPIIRANRRKEFNPADYEIDFTRKYAWDGTLIPMLTVDVNLTEVDLPYMGGQRRDYPRRQTARKPTVRPSL